MDTDQAILEAPVLDAVGDGTRRAILDLLARSPRSVGELAAELPVSRPAVSLHLKVLRDAGLVTSSPAGTRNVYRLDQTGLAVLRRYLDRLWAAALDRFAAAAEATALAEAAWAAGEPATSPDPHADPEAEAEQGDPRP